MPKLTPHNPNTHRYTDAEFIRGLKENNPRIVDEFFYHHCAYMLNDLRVYMLKGFYEYDEMVSELYLHLSEDNWHRLDTFNGKNKSSLKTWMARVSWTYFNRIRLRLLGLPVSDGMFDNIKMLLASSDETTRSEIRIDVMNTLEAMPNKQYSTALRLMVIEDYDPNEVADILNTTVNNVYNIKHRAISQFIKVFNGDE